MFTDFIIAFRETLEAALVVGIVVSCLIKSGYTRYQWSVYSALAVGVGGSFIGALLLSRLSSYFTGGSAEKIFEAVIMVIAASLLIATIFWLRKYRASQRYLEKQVARGLLHSYPQMAIFGLVATAVLREGIEMVIFLNAAVAFKDTINVISIVSGIAFAAGLGYLTFLTSLKIPLKYFFAVTNSLLTLLAASLIARGIYEIVEL